DNDKLTMTLGPSGKPTTFVLTHYNGDTFSFQSVGENANGLAGAIFTVGAAGTASKVRLDFYDRTGLGTFTPADHRVLDGVVDLAVLAVGVGGPTTSPAAHARRVSPNRCVL